MVLRWKDERKLILSLLKLKFTIKTLSFFQASACEMLLKSIEKVPVEVKYFIQFLKI